MTMTKSANLVRKAEQARPSRIRESLPSFPSRRSAGDSATALELAYSPWVQALDAVNQHITVKQAEFAAAEEAYNDVANLLVANLDWPQETISICSQGSASTQTLIRSPIGNQKFDIDAVCQVEISRFDANDPMGFFQSVGDALEELKPSAKKRCWNIPYPNRPFYLEFTPSVPLATVLNRIHNPGAIRYRAAPKYQATALAVVDTPTKQWKTSNPKGISAWVADTAKRRLLSLLTIDARIIVEKAEVTPVPTQEVRIDDTLRIAIRLFKRHRDMYVRKGIIQSEFQPISIIIVTLLTQCYEGLADLGRTFNHPLELLDELATLMPYLIEHDEHGYRVDNPTVLGENFAEKWNDDGGARHRAWVNWCKCLSGDLKTILALTDPNEISKRAHEIFGIPAPTSTSTRTQTSGYRAPLAPPPGKGLA